MVFIKKFFLLSILIFLQSCDGGKIGNFLESSFENIEESKIKVDNNNFKKEIVVKADENEEKDKIFEESKIKVNNKNNFKKKIVVKADENAEKNNIFEESKIKVDNKNNLKKNLFITSEEKSNNNKKIIKKNITRQKRKYQPQSYKIIFILKDVDPKDPIEDLSTILRNSDVNFEIEKIERFFDSKNKSIKNN